ncbi:ankyrin repeat protein [Dictyocaulus viviparus]|uniref:Ankyrin repeat protein n=1 Tax=Dictyocaulus viviparus TaxID=29172 RepID=A0A0D8XWW4_DICVI|nr:ankyrin repeat protein [Dictyocaulus viviparus]
MDSRRESDFPLHRLVYLNDIDALKCVLDEIDPEDLEKLDCRGRTPLMLAVTMGHKQCAYELLKRGADADSQNRGLTFMNCMWSVSHEAISLGDPDLVKNIIMYRDRQRSLKGAQRMKDCLNNLRIFKQGSKVRIDATLFGYESNSWKRGNQTYIFQLGTDDCPELVIIDHDSRTAVVQTFCADEPLEEYAPSETAIEMRMTSPISTTFVDVDKIGFERSYRNGLLSWISNVEKLEIIDDYQCKNETSNFLTNFLNTVKTATCEESTKENLLDMGLTVDEYLDENFTLNGDIGRPKQVTKKSNNFKATIWLAEDHPLSFQIWFCIHEQIIPIVDLMASNSAHFARLHKFIQMQLPAGFPIRIEIPILHVINAKVTLGRINEPGPMVTPLRTMSGFKVTAVAIDDDAFCVPQSYNVINDSNMRLWWLEDDYDMSNTHDEALSFYQFPVSNASLSYDELQEQRQLSLAISESLRISDNFVNVPNEPEDELALALRLSRDEENKRKEESRREEMELERILKLSLLDK